MIQNILFDLDGTLTDPKAGITQCIRFSLGHFTDHIPGADDLTWCIGPPLRDSFARLLNTTDSHILDQAVSLYRERFSEKGMFENKVYPDVHQSLEQIKASGIRIFLATSKPRVYARKILDHFGLSHFFKKRYGAELDGRFVDKGELIAHILGAEGLDSKTTLMIGDRVYDIAGGKKNNLMTAAVTYGYGSRDEIASSNPDLVFDSLADLPAFLLTTVPGNA